MQAGAVASHQVSKPNSKSLNPDIKSLRRSKTAPRRRRPKRRPPRAAVPGGACAKMASRSRPPPSQVPRPAITLAVAVPQTLGPSRRMRVQAPDGRLVDVIVPPNLRPGQQLHVQFPAERSIAEELLVTFVNGLADRGSPFVFACRALAALSCNRPDSSKPEPW